jgi:hypothetical protein
MPLNCAGDGGNAGFPDAPTTTNSGHADEVELTENGQWLNNKNFAPLGGKLCRRVALV